MGGRQDMMGVDARQLDVTRRPGFLPALRTGVKRVLPAVFLPPIGMLLAYWLLLPVYSNLGVAPVDGVQEAYGCIVGAGFCFSLGEMCLEGFLDLQKTKAWTYNEHVPFRETAMLVASLVSGCFMDCLGGFYSLSLTLKSNPADWVGHVVLAVSILCVVATMLSTGLAGNVMDSLEFASARREINSNKLNEEDGYA